MKFPVLNLCSLYLSRTQTTSDLQGCLPLTFCFHSHVSQMIVLSEEKGYTKDQIFYPIPDNSHPGEMAMTPCDSFIVGTSDGSNVTYDVVIKSWPSPLEVCTFTFTLYFPAQQITSVNGSAVMLKNLMMMFTPGWAMCTNRYFCKIFQKMNLISRNLLRYVSASPVTFLITA